MECPLGRKWVSLKENTPSVHLIPTLEWGHYIRDPRAPATHIPGVASCGPAQASFLKHHDLTWVPSHLPHPTAQANASSPVLPHPRATPRRTTQQSAWLNTILNNVLLPPALQGVLPLFSFSGNCFLWHSGTPQIPGSLQRHGIETQFKHPPQSIKLLCYF